MQSRHKNTDLEVCKKTDVGSDFVGSSAERCERSKDIGVNLARVRLGGHWVSVFEARELGDKLIELFDLKLFNNGRKKRGGK
jgi:hypothetical protein